MTDIERSIVGTMAKFTHILLLLYLLKYNLAEECPNSIKEPEYRTWLKELYEELMCYKSKKAPPGINTIGVHMNVERYSLQTDKEIFSAETVLNITWKDERLMWDPDKHHGIKETETDEFFYWIPQMELINVEDMFNNEITSLYLCKIQYMGLVNCRHKMYHETWCSVKLTNWPYDVQECSLEFGHEYLSKENYTIHLRTAIADDYTAGWHITEFKQDYNVGGRIGVRVTFVLEREAAGLSAIYIHPALVLTVLNIVTLFLDVRRNVRLAVSCFTLSIHYYMLVQLDIDMPKGNAFTPIILLYYRGSIIVTIITILLTLILSKVCSLKSNPHNYIKLVNDFVCDNKYSSYLVFPKWESDDVTVDSKSSNEDYVIFANVVNSVFLFLIVFTYFGLYISKIPK